MKYTSPLCPVTQQQEFSRVFDHDHSPQYHNIYYRITLLSSQSFMIRMRLNTTLLLLATLFLPQGNSSFLIIREDLTSNDSDSNEVPSQQYGGGSPPPAQTQASVCGCKRILLSSLGPAAHYQPQAMGIYEL